MKEVNPDILEIITGQFMNSEERGIYTACLLHPYQNISINQEAALSFQTLVNPVNLDTDPYWKSDIGILSLRYTRAIVRGFLRREVNKEFPLWEIKQQSKKGIFQIEAEVKLWISTYNLINKLNIHLGLISSLDAPVLRRVTEHHPIVGLAKLAVECALILPTNYDERILDNKKISVNEKISVNKREFVKKRELGKSSTTRIIRILQQQNRELRNVEENPFDEQKAYTCELITKARALAGESNDFHSGEWEAMIRSREQLVKVLREGQCTNGVKLEHRGRSKRGRAKTIDR